MMRRAVVGVHHKTGSVLSSEILRLLIEFVPGRPANAVTFAEIPNGQRKQPLSVALRHVPRALFTGSMWCEHEIDVRGVNFLHFVRHPLPRLTSAYLYHKRGAPTDAMRWADWPIFDFQGRKSYAELLNVLDLGDGLMVEAIRTYPEAAGSARACASAAKLPEGQSLPVRLDEFGERPVEALTAIFEFVYGSADGRLGEFLAEAAARNIVPKDGLAAPASDHATRNDATRPAVDQALAGSAEIARLYLGLEPDMAGAAPTAGPPVVNLIDEIRLKTDLLLQSPEAAQSRAGFWSDSEASAIWQAFALSNFANGHLMMRPFIQQYLSRLA